MRADLVLPFMPSNMQLPAGTAKMHVDGDLYHICERIRELDPSLFVIPLPESSHPWRFSIGEYSRDGAERLIFHAKELDARVLDHLGKIMALPLTERLKRLEREEYQFDAERKEQELEQMYEEVGRPMLTQLAHDGFIDRPVSYPKTGVTGGRGSRKKAVR